MLTKFEVGQPLPLPLLTAPGFELCRSTFNESFFDIVYWIPDNDSTQVFTKSKLEYGLYHLNNVPFFLVDFPGKIWNFDVSLNIKKVQDDKVDAWLNAEGNIINLYLCDCVANVLLGMRLISIQPAIVEKIRDVLERQDEQYENASDVDQAIASITRAFTTEDMINRTKMISL